jgi:hypothetical protein
LPKYRTERKRIAMQNLSPPLFLAVLAVCASCSKPVVAGSGTQSVEERGFSGYTSIVATGTGLKLVARVGDTELVRISGDDNLVPLVETSLSGSTLSVGTGKRVLRPKHPLVVEVTSRRLQEVRLAGAIDAEVLDFDDDRLAVELTGVGAVRLSGTAGNLAVTIHGAGRLDGTDLVARNAEVSVLGAGEARVHVTGRLVAKIVGAGAIHYAGKPILEPTVTGVGSLKPLGPK